MKELTVLGLIVGLILFTSPWADACWGQLRTMPNQVNKHKPSSDLQKKAQSKNHSGSNADLISRLLLAPTHLDRINILSKTRILF